MHADYPYKARSALSGRRNMLIATILVAVVIIIDLVTGGKVQSLVQSATTPLWRGGAHIWSDVANIGFFSSRASLEAQINELQTQLTQAQLHAAANGIIQQQNTTLSQMVHLSQANPGITAPIVSSLLSSPYGTFLIGAGSRDGVTVGELVLAADTSGNDGFVIGTVSEVDPHTALVEEIFAPGVATDVVIDGASVSATGEGGENAKAGVAHGVSVAAGDPVVAPGYGGRAVGIVGHVVSDPANAQSQIYIALPVSLPSLGFVYITP